MNAEAEVTAKVREGVDMERQRLINLHAAALDAANSQAELVRAESIAEYERLKSEAVSSALNDFSRDSEQRLSQQRTMVQNESATSLLRMQSMQSLDAAMNAAKEPSPGPSPGSRRGSEMGKPNRRTSFAAEFEGPSQPTRRGSSSTNVRRTSLKEDVMESYGPGGVETCDVATQFPERRGSPVSSPPKSQPESRASSRRGSRLVQYDSPAAAPLERTGSGGYVPEKLPDKCVTNLGVIKFKSKRNKAMPIMRCRRLAMTLMQCRYTVDKADDKAGEAHQDFKTWLVDQVLMLYGTYPLASKTLHEFAYGMRKTARWRRTHEPEDGREPEPIIHFFWRASQLGVPSNQIVGSEDIDFFCELLGAVADKVGSDHTLKLRSGAFWSAVGTACELVIPMYILLAALRRTYARSQPELYKRMSEAIQTASRRYVKMLKANKIPEIRGYHRRILGDRNAEGGHLPLEAFLKHCMDQHAEMRIADGQRMQDIFSTWDYNGDSSYDAFYEMVRHASSTIDERKILELYEQSLDPSTHLVSMMRIDGLVHRAKIELAPFREEDEEEVEIERGRAESIAAEFTRSGSIVQSPTTMSPPASLSASFKQRKSLGDGGPSSRDPSPNRAGAPSMGDIALAMTDGSPAAAASGGDGSVAKERWQHAIAIVRRHNLTRSLFHNQLLEANLFDKEQGLEHEQEKTSIRDMRETSPLPRSRAASRRQSLKKPMPMGSLDGALDEEYDEFGGGEMEPEEDAEDPELVVYDFEAEEEDQLALTAAMPTDSASTNQPRTPRQSTVAGDGATPRKSVLVAQLNIEFNGADEDEDEYEASTLTEAMPARITISHHTYSPDTSPGASPTPTRAASQAPSRRPSGKVIERKPSAKEVVSTIENFQFSGSSQPPSRRPSVAPGSPEVVRPPTYTSAAKRMYGVCAVRICFCVFAWRCFRWYLEEVHSHLISTLFTHISLSPERSAAHHPAHPRPTTRREATPPRSQPQRPRATCPPHDQSLLLTSQTSAHCEARGAGRSCSSFA